MHKRSSHMKYRYKAYALNKRRDSENGEADTIPTDDRDRVRNRVSGRVIIRRNSVCRNRVCQNSVVYPIENNCHYRIAQM